ncbi:multiple sugar transport system permease protein [Leifsonia sp. 98AMF]|uniref:carbohydrate ABC transporter permease n=1 Tax=unclassified Leifsonia TaxID=2663824 RepID=UPI000879B360|nr:MULTISPECIES: sugar ABC transporter permease [unclassified Leifsonia]SDH54706.1 multiple sugar transport system permease protein [Leifsonia sp. 197AMF]SDI83973.1 multiple sugar transport system permease protein [Leifsonia sp. 466MF]SDJ99332.1 carbohydrate ABC transporter membrane protein 1, CUT1 family [Leifsonia sp. 157MF]SDN87249.1 multiple sugar transport system permease protein [Leifsonia sp. 509MF]SEN18888.1 multiple sugar transport system permease protein [Leifsonia sp. 467MF]
MTSTAEATRAGAATGRPRRGASPKPTGGASDLWHAVPWTLPALILIFGVVLFPAGYMIYNSTRKISIAGVDHGSVGLKNYITVLSRPELPGILLNTLVWVVSVVVITVVISLALAQFLDKNFPGRRWVRMAIIVPWAASVVMTTTVFVYGLDPFYGIINKFLVDIHVLAEPFGFTKEPIPAFISSIGIAVFVSLPFTTYTILAGLAGIPGDMLEAAKMDGAGAFRSYFSVTLPNLRNAIALAALINIINVFNSLPILKLMTGSIPGYKADTTTTYVFKLLQNEQRIDLSSALSVINFLIVLVVVGIYLWVVKPMKEVS